MSRIEQSVEDLVSPQLLRAVEDQEVLVVSGQPLRVFDSVSSENDKFLEDCEPLVDELLFAPFRLFVQRVPSAGHSNHSNIFLSDEGYPALSGYDISGAEVVMGIREALNFNLKLDGNL